MKTKDKGVQMAKIIDAALNRFEAYELMKMLLAQVKNEEREEMIKEMAFTCAYEGFFVVKTNSLSDVMKLEDFTKQHICTSYNEQQANLFF